MAKAACRSLLYCLQRSEWLKVRALSALTIKNSEEPWIYIVNALSAYMIVDINMSRISKPTLYIKSGCPWCREALSFFNSHGVDVDIRDVSESARDMDAMVSLSGQTQAPTFQYEDFTVANFSVDEFLAELDEFPEIRQKLGIGDDES